MSKRGVVIHHNGPQANCVGQPHDRCERFWDGVRRYHGQKFGAKWAETSLYSFGVCPHGSTFIGCGWHKNQAANGSDRVGVDDGRDSEWYTVLAFYGGGAWGGFDTGEPEEPVTLATLNAIEGLRHDGIARGYCRTRVLPHNVFKSKACPAETLTRFAISLDGGQTGPITTTPEEDDMAVVLSHFRTKAGSNDKMHTYRVDGNVASWCGTHAEIKAAEFFGATWFGPLEPDAWKSLAVINGPLANQDRR